MKTLTRTLISRLLFAFLLSVPKHAAGQDVILTQGEEVRVRWYDDSWAGMGLEGRRSTTAEVMWSDSSLIVVRQGRRAVMVPLAAVTRIERRVGTKPASAPAMVMGSGIGFAAGFLGGLFVSQLARTATGDDAVNSGLTAGILVGAPVGAFVAYLTSRSRGIYEDIGFGRIVTDLNLAPTGRVGVSVRVGGR